MVERVPIFSCLPSFELTNVRASAAVVVDVYIVTDRSSSASSSGSLHVTLLGESQVVLQTAELSSEVLQKRISKVTMALEKEAVIKFVKVGRVSEISIVALVRTNDDALHWTD
jgi:hypothetical protein